MWCAGELKSIPGASMSVHALRSVPPRARALALARRVLGASVFLESWARSNAARPDVWVRGRTASRIGAEPTPVLTLAHCVPALAYCLR